MIFRTYLECAGCNRELLLRIEVLPTKLTRILFDCPYCSYGIRGQLRGLEVDSIRLEWDDARERQIDVRNPDPPGIKVRTVGLVTPLAPNAHSMRDFGGSPNITFGQLVADPLSANNFHGRLHGRINTWQIYERFLHYYWTEQWEYFDAA